MFDTFDYNFQRAQADFHYEEKNEFVDRYSHIDTVTIGEIGAYPACRIITKPVYNLKQNTVSGAQAVERMKTSLQDKKALLLYPENYQDLTLENLGSHCEAGLYIIAENLTDFTNVLTLIPSAEASKLVNRLELDTLSDSLKTWKEKLAA